MRDRIEAWVTSLIAAIICTLAVSGASGLTYKMAHKINAKANADVRSSYAQERTAMALERIATQMEKR